MKRSPRLGQVELVVIANLPAEEIGTGGLLGTGSGGRRFWRVKAHEADI
jgi:hypothetical protein